MDPDTSKKVTDLLSIMEDMSSDIDAKGELGKLFDEVQALRNEIAGLNKRFEHFEKTYLEKKKIIDKVREDLQDLLDNN